LFIYGILIAGYAMIEPIDPGGQNEAKGKMGKAKAGNIDKGQAARGGPGNM